MRALLLALAVAMPLLAGCLGAGEHPGLAPAGTPRSVAVSSDAFAQGARIPRVHTCEGDNVAPPLRYGALPEGTRSVALVMDDPDATRGTFLHWTVWNLPAEDTLLRQGQDPASVGAMQGANGGGRAQYAGPCPPPGSGEHRYFFRAYALDATLALARGAPLTDLQAAMEGRVLAWGELMGMYARG